MTKLGIGVPLAFLLACALPLQAQEPTAVEVKRGEAPELNTPTTKEVGDVLYSKFNYTEDRRNQTRRAYWYEAPHAENRSAGGHIPVDTRRQEEQKLLVA